MEVEAQRLRSPCFIVTMLGMLTCQLLIALWVIDDRGSCAIFSIFYRVDRFHLLD
jgi:hypothetical protein